MIYHILNGDALVDRFSQTELPGEISVMRECLIEGDLAGNTLADFLETRAGFIDRNYGGSYDSVLGEINKILHAPSSSEFNVWFGYDLFCQTNLWFLLSLINNLPIAKNVFVVYPSYLSKEKIWEEFGPATPHDLETCYTNRIVFTRDDLTLGENLWRVYKENDLAELKKLSQTNSECFPYLKEVCSAHIERFDLVSRPEKVVREILKDSFSGFHDVFKEFTRREGIYGFGDSQLKKIYDKVITF